MGEDKGLTRFRGKFLIQSVIEQIASIGEELLITSNFPDNYAFLGVAVVADILPEKGALAGLYTALSLCQGGPGDCCWL